MGLGITLKVMAGDRIDIRGKSYYNQSNTDGSTANGDLAVLDVLSGLVGAAGGVVSTTSHEAVSGTQLNGYSGLTQEINNFKSTQTSDVSGTTRPKAYINYIFFDEQFNYAGGSFDEVADDPGIKDHNLAGIAVPKNGYVYIYCSNESPVNVFFDNVQVVHTRGAMLEETHYYPFGLTMQGISSKAASFGEPNNKFKYNGKEEQRQEFSDGNGLEAYDFGARIYDPQIGRMWQVDPWVEKYERQSPYVAFNDNPIIFADPTGKGGVLTVERNEETGEWYLKVTAKIYIYSKKGVDEARKHAGKIQNDIMSQWNNPTETDENGNPIDGAKAYGQYGNMKGKVVFDVSVEAVSIEDAEAMAKDNTDVSVNFMGLDATGTSHAKGNSGEFNLTDLYAKGSTNAAHEFGHLLGYYNPLNDPKDEPGSAAFDTHATRRATAERNETYYIMGGYSGDQSKRRVDPEEYTRVNHGLGIRINNANQPVPIVVDPTGSNKNKNNLTNTIYK